MPLQKRAERMMIREFAVGERRPDVQFTLLTEGDRTFIHLQLPEGFALFIDSNDTEKAKEINDFIVRVLEEKGHCV